MLYKFPLAAPPALVLAIVASASADAITTLMTTSAVLVFATASGAFPVSLVVTPGPATANSSYPSSTLHPSVVATVQKIDQPTTTPLTSIITGLFATETATATEIGRLSPIQEGDNPPRNGLAHSTVAAIAICLFLFIGLVGSIFIWMSYYRPTRLARMPNDDSTPTAVPMKADHWGTAPSSHDVRLVGRGQ